MAKRYTLWCHIWHSSLWVYLFVATGLDKFRRQRWVQEYHHHLVQEYHHQKIKNGETLYSMVSYMALVSMGIPFCGDRFGIVCGTRLCGCAHLFFFGDGFVVTVWWRCVLFVPMFFGVAAL